MQHSSEELNASAPNGGPATLGDLKASGHLYRTVKQEIRENLLTRMRAGQDRFPGIVGFDQTVLPHVERALLAGHDIILLGERGQGKTRLIRTLGELLDEWTPVITGCEINDHPYAPACARCRRLAAELGDELGVSWRHKSERYGEKLATPDTSVGDLIGDIDPVKVAEGRTLGDPETIHFGLVPRTNRGIFCLNELPDLAERIQVALLNVLEERDIGVRGYSLRLPLDIVLVASANPEDYTNRGRIITPLKDRFGAEVRTHYPIDLEDELHVVRQEALIEWGGDAVSAALPDHLVEVIARFTRHVRESPAVDARSGVSARFAVAAAET
ncbi:MAG: sigma 54-interacting transcriptional regulator, partial [Trebonia sp.]